MEVLRAEEPRRIAEAIVKTDAGTDAGTGQGERVVRPKEKRGLRRKRKGRKNAEGEIRFGWRVGRRKRTAWGQEVGRRRQAQGRVCVLPGAWKTAQNFDSLVAPPGI